jgi:hypothetical protein
VLSGWPEVVFTHALEVSEPDVDRVGTHRINDPIDRAHARYSTTIGTGLLEAVASAAVAGVPDSCQIARLNERTHGQLRRNDLQRRSSQTCDRHAHRQAVLPSWWCGFDSRHPLSRKRPGQDHIPELGFADCGSTSCARFVPNSCLPLLRGHFLVSTGGSAVRDGADRDNHRLSGR